MMEKTKESIKKNGSEEKYFYLAVRDKKGDYTIYMSERFRIPEYELLSLLQLLIKERRLVGIGRKILWAYQDSQNYSNEAHAKLKEKGIEVEKNETETIKDGKIL
jgi:hypothetical protein